MRIRGVAGAAVAVAPIGYLVAVNMSQLERLGSELALPTLTAGEAWAKSGLHLLGFLVIPLLGTYLALGNQGTIGWARAAFLPGRAPGRALRTTGWLSLALLSTVVVGMAMAPTDRPGLFSLETSRTAFAALPLHAALAISAAAALSEELVFRGLMLRGLMRRFDTGFAIALQAVAFGAIHIAYGSVFHALMATAFGAFLGTVALRAGLGASILLHFQVNAVVLALWSDAQPATPVVLAVLAVATWLVVAGHRAGHAQTVAEPLPVAADAAPVTT